MIWTMRIECLVGMNYEQECVRIVEIDSNSSLYDLHDLIQDAVDFDRDHLFEFFAGRNYRNRKITFDYSDDCEEEFENWSAIKLEQIYPLEKGLKLYYLFDFGDSWYFEIKKSRKKPLPPEPGIRYPRIIESIGPNPQQYGSWEDDDEENEE